ARRPDCDSGVVVQYIDPPEFRDRRVEHRTRVTFLGDVGPDERRAPSGALDELDAFRAHFFVEIRDHDRRAFFGQALRSSTPDSRAAAGYHRDFILNFHIRTPSAVPTIRA